MVEEQNLCGHGKVERHGHALTDTRPSPWAPCTFCFACLRKAKSAIGVLHEPGQSGVTFGDKCLSGASFPACTMSPASRSSSAWRLRQYGA